LYSGGASFEFLPVTVQNLGGILQATLRMGVHVGVDAVAPPLALDGIPIPELKAGIETVLYADVIQFTTNVTFSNSSNCDILVEESYQFGLGAEAGATVALGNHVWGPNIETSTPIFYTTLATACLDKNASSPTSQPVNKREPQQLSSDLTTTTLTTIATFTGIACVSSGMVNCPVSLQQTSKNISTLTLVTSVPSGVEATFPATTQSVVTTVPFGKSVKFVTETTGSPISYIPPPPNTTTSTSSKSIFVLPSNPITSKLSSLSKEEKKKVIGVSVGLGLPVLILITVGVTW
jgi:hypothetical protein